MTQNLPFEVLRQLRAQGRTLATAESCTGGLIGKLLTDVPGSSEVYMGGVISYTNGVKHRLLGVSEDTLRVYTAVSRQTAHEMAHGAREAVQADVGVSVTGLAGPDGDGVHPVGTVFVSLSDGKRTWVREKHITDRDRKTVRLYACQNVFDMVRRYLAGLPVEQKRSDI